MTLRVNPTAAMLACLALCAVPGSSHAADTITLDPRVIPVGKWAEGIAIADNKLWVAESGQRSIAQVDLNRGNVVRRVQVGRLPVGMVTGSDGAVYSLVQTDRLVWQQLPNGRTRSFGGLEGCPQGLAGSDRFLWVLTMPECSSVSSRLIRMNPNGGDPTSSRVFSEWAQAITTHQGKVWVAHARTPALTIVDEQTLSVRTANLAGVSLWAVTACCGNVHVGGRLGDEKTGGIVLSIDPATFQERRRHLVEQRIAVMADDDQSVVAVGEKGTIWVFSADRLELQRTITLATGAFDPKAVLIRRRRSLSLKRPAERRERRGPGPERLASRSGAGAPAKRPKPPEQPERHAQHHHRMPLRGRQCEFVGALDARGPRYGCSKSRRASLERTRSRSRSMHQGLVPRDIPWRERMGREEEHPGLLQLSP
jgi:hypothetical protein